MSAHTGFKGLSVSLALAGFISSSCMAWARAPVDGGAGAADWSPFMRNEGRCRQNYGNPPLVAQQDAVQQGFVQQEAESQGQSPTRASGARFRLKRPGAESSSTPQPPVSPGSVTPDTAAPLSPSVPAGVQVPSFDTHTNSEPAASTPLQGASSGSSGGEGKVIWRPGIILSGTAGETALNPTCDLSLAASQASEFPDSAEAAFIHAVALTRSSQVEAALKEVRRARNLARATGDPNYFNRAVSQYEQSLDADPNNSCVRYGLSWAYYMQAYLLGEQARKQESIAKQPIMPQMYRKKSHLGDNLLSGATILASALTGTKPPVGAVPHIPGALEGAPTWAIPQIKQYYQKSINQLDQVIKREPTNAWAATYRVHVNEEYDGNNEAALRQLEALKKRFPDNPAVAFFLADSYARNGNFAAGAGSLGRAVQLKLQGK